jgi:hypothetical protein
MGQFALGIRSLLFKAAIFVVLAALLAWALGGTLFPRPSRTEFHAATFAGHQWMWRVSVYDRRAFEKRDPAKTLQWELSWHDTNDKRQGLTEYAWTEVAGPVVSNNLMYFGGFDDEWVIYVINADSRVVEQHAMPDRLAVEQQLARIQANLPIQNAQTIENQRSGVVDPSPNSADTTVPRN